MKINEVSIKAKQFVTEKKKAWANSIYQRTLERLLLEKFPEEFTVASLKLHKSNEKMYPMIERVEKAVHECLTLYKEDIGEAIHKV